MKSSVNFILLALGEEHTASFRISIRKLIKFTSCKKTVILFGWSKNNKNLWKCSFLKYGVAMNSTVVNMEYFLFLADCPINWMFGTAIADTILIITSILLFGIWGLQTPLIFSG